MLPTRNYAGIDGAITQRPVASAIFGVDSEDRYRNMADQRQVGLTGATANCYNFSINKESSILNGFFTRIGVTEVVFPWVVPNINLKTNKILVLYRTGTVGPVTANLISLEPGFYTPSQLANAIQTAVRLLNASLSAFTMVYGITATGAKNTVFTYATNNGGPVAAAYNPATTYAIGNNVSYQGLTYTSLINGNTGNTPDSSPAAWSSLATYIAFSPLVVPNSIAPLLKPNTLQLFDLLGFGDPDNDSPDTARSVTGISGGYTLCQYTKYIDITCLQLTNNQSLKDNSTSVVNRDTLCRIYITSPTSTSTVDPSSATFCPTGCAPFVIYKDYTTPKMIQWLPNQPVPGQLTFAVYDDNGDLLSEADVESEVNANRTNWSMTMLASEN